MPKLYLIPNAIDALQTSLLPAYIAPCINHVRVFFVEEPKSARRLLKHFNAQFPLQECTFLDLNEHTNPEQVKVYIKYLNSADAAIISESGCPCVADPGSDLVLLAHQHNITVIPLIGPSSIVMALMASGLDGQNFAFNGYLSKDTNERRMKIKLLEARAYQENQTQVFMDTPYRNQHLFEDVCASCFDKTLLCIALGITSSEEFIKTKSIRDWKKTGHQLPKKPALFIIGSTSRTMK